MMVAGREIAGRLACEPVSTEANRDGSKRDQWVVFELYELDNGNWLAHRAGMSVVYHAASTSCRTRTGVQSGEPAGVDDLPDEAVPCERCRPPYPADLPPGPGTVRFEVPRHTWDEAPTAAQIRTALTTIRGRDGSITEKMSAPVDKLLHNAAERHEEFARLLSAAA